MTLDASRHSSSGFKKYIQCSLYYDQSFEICNKVKKEKEAPLTALSGTINIINDRERVVKDIIKYKK